MEILEYLCIACGDVKQCSHCEKQYGSSSKSHTLELPYDLAIPQLGIYPKELKSGTQTGIYVPMFTVALFTTPST